MNLTRIIFWGLLLGLLGTLGLLLIDSIKGDANGVVAGFNLLPVAQYGFYAFVAYSFWYAFKQKIAWAQNLFVSLIMVVLTIVLLEWICGIVLKQQSSKNPVTEGPKHSRVMDEVLGYKPQADTLITGVKTRGKDTIYAISYSTDKNNLRITPTDTTKPRTKYAQFYGCSMTFGEGVQSNETTSYYFSKFDSTYRAYNFAYSGYGPSQMLARLESNTVRQIVKEKNGFCVFVYINDHINRVIGSMTNYSYNGGNAPYFHKVGGVLKHDKLFIDSRKIRSWIYSKLFRSNILKLFKIGYPFKLTEEDYELTAEVIAESSRLYKQQFGNDNFYVVIYPTPNYSELMVNLLKKKGLKILDYSKLFDAEDSKYAIPYDEHPKALANEILSKQLIKDIN
jgi:hypothetical protein